jgi:hypothetical protein
MTSNARFVIKSTGTTHARKSLDQLNEKKNGGG